MTAPYFTRSGRVIYPLPKIIVIGGAATGNMNAKEAAVVVAIIKASGLSNAMTEARVAAIGNITEVVAVLEVILESLYHYTGP